MHSEKKAIPLKNMSILLQLITLAQCLEIQILNSSLSINYASQRSIFIENSSRRPVRLIVGLTVSKTGLKFNSPPFLSHFIRLIFPMNLTQLHVEHQRIFNYIVVTLFCYET